MDDVLAVTIAERLAGVIAIHGADAVPLALALTARIGVRGPVWVVDGGNRFDALWVANYLARLGLAPEPVLARIRVSRAFTCYQMAERVLSLPAEGAAEPLVMLEWLDTFYDENVPLAEARRLLNCMWPALRRRSGFSPVALVVRSPRSERVAERERFYDACLRLAGYCVEAHLTSLPGLCEATPPSSPDYPERREGKGVGGEVRQIGEIWDAH